MSEREPGFAGDPADQSEKRDWDVPARDAAGEHPEPDPPDETEQPHPGVHGSVPDESERRDWDVP